MKTRITAALAALWFSGALGDGISPEIAEDAARGGINLREALGEESTAEPESVLT